LAQELGISLEKFQHLLGELRGLDLRSLQSETMDEVSEGGVSNFKQASDDEDSFSLCLRSEMTGLLAQAIEELPERERQLLALYYYEELTMKEAGAVLGIGEARVSQLHSAAIVRLRARMKELLKVRGPAGTQKETSLSMGKSASPTAAGL
jgi:RNA polymerase sigma factor for flagellar operon FliA